MIGERAPREPAERRRVERRTTGRLADVTLPELRRILVTSILAVLVVVLFLWMVRAVIIAGILGAVIAAYLRPLYLYFLRRVRKRNIAAMLALAVVILPVLAALVYSYREVVNFAEYLNAHQDEITARIDGALQRISFLEHANSAHMVRNWVLLASNYGTGIPRAVQRAIVGFSVSATIFLFTAAYIFTEGEAVVAYVRGKVPPRYAELSGALESNVRGVLYGAIYATLLTQSLKSAVIFLMNVLFGVPLAAVLAILAFIIGFFPIVGSWSVYVPVALWLLVFRDSPVQAALMIAVGLLLNTLFISMYLRPKLAAERSRVLNFYWMFVGLVTGVYTFGLAGILLGPILIGLLKAVIDTVTATSSWRLLAADGATVDADAETVA